MAEATHEELMADSSNKCSVTSRASIKRSDCSSAADGHLTRYHGMGSLSGAGSGAVCNLGEAPGQFRGGRGLSRAG